MSVSPERCGVPDNLVGIGFPFVGIREMGAWLGAVSVFSGGGRGVKL